MFPRPCPKTPQSGEHIAHADAVQHLVRCSTLSGDCKGVVAAAQDQSDRPLNRKRLHAASTRAVRTSPSLTHVAEERWVKAHVADDIAKLAKDPAAMQRKLDSLTRQEKLDALANSEADDAAKFAMTEDKANAADQHVFDLHAATYAKTVRIAKVIGTMLLQWPSNTERGEKSTNGKT